jgi:hypothetical protein
MRDALTGHMYALRREAARLDTGYAFTAGLLSAPIGYSASQL